MNIFHNIFLLLIVSTNIFSMDNTYGKKSAPIPIPQTVIGASRQLTDEELKKAISKAHEEQLIFDPEIETEEEFRQRRIADAIRSEKEAKKYMCQVSPCGNSPVYHLPTQLNSNQSHLENCDRCP